MKTTSLALAALIALSFAPTAFGEGAGKESAAPVGPPQPRVVEALARPSLPPREADPSWILFQDGLRLYREKRLGEALLSFKAAIEARYGLYSRTLADVDAALGSKEAKKAKDSLSALARLLAARDLIPQEIEAIGAKASGSTIAEMRLLREKSPSAPLRGLIDATILAAEQRGLSRFADSLAALRKAVADSAYYPEAEFWIGKTYLAEGELALAESQIRRACDMAPSLELGGDRYGMLETLAGLYKDQGDLRSYETSLREIADASELFSAKDEYFRNSMERSLEDRGFDKFMTLYRSDEGFALSAFSSLGELYLEAGRPIATIYLAAAVNGALSRAIAEIKIDEPGYSYAGLADLETRILSSAAIARYANEAGLWKDLVLLGSALSSTGYRDTAREIWSAIAKAPVPEPWGKRAAAALARPASASIRPLP